MSSENLLEGVESIQRTPNDDASSLLMTSSSNDSDADEVSSAKLIRSGSMSSMSRHHFTAWSVLGIGFSLTNSWFGVSAALIAGINSGGPVLLVYGIPLIALMSCSVGISLAELSSAMPHAGGQIHWAGELAEEEWAGVASYATGWFAWTGSLFTSSSVALAIGSAICGCFQLLHPELEVKSWMVFTAYQLVNLFCFFFNIWGKTLAKIAQLTLYISLVSFLTILATVTLIASPHQSPKFVFATFINNTGWNSSFIAYVVGLVNANWAFACLDSATHLAEEVQNPERVVPIAILGTIAIGFITSWLYAVAMFFSIVGDLETIVMTPTLVPILELYHQALDNAFAAVALEFLIIATGCGCLIASHTWQSRLCWSFARDRGLPGHQWLSKVHPKLDVPLNAHILSCGIVSIAGSLYLGSYTAFNSMATACIVLLYASYAIPVYCLLVRGRESIKPGPFWLGKYGYVANLILLVWTLFTLIMYSFPYTMPVSADTMNYVSVVYGIVGCILALDWTLRGKSDYRGHGWEHEEEATLL